MSVNLRSLRIDDDDIIVAIDATRDEILFCIVTRHFVDDGSSGDGERL